MYGLTRGTTRICIPIGTPSPALPCSGVEHCRLRYLPRRKLAKGHFSARPDRPCGGSPTVDANGSRIEAARLGLVIYICIYYR